MEKIEKGSNCQNNLFVIGEKSVTGITLVALVVTIVVLLILAGITINYVLGDNSVFKQATNAKEKTEIAKAREKLEIVLGSAKIEKHTNNKYNENEYLDEYIINQIKEAEIIDDVVIVNRYAFELDRSVPKIGEYIGKKEELVFPELSITKLVLSADKKNASFTITAREQENGISKMEIIQEGHVIRTYEYENEKGEIQEIYTTTQNGKYVVRVYAKLTVSKVIQVEGIVPSVNFEPNGNEEYKKEHFTKITLNETADKVTSMKYQWTNTTQRPKEETFKDVCNNGDTITKNGLTGTYYLWILLGTASGETSIWRSEGFNFDNEGPTVTLTSTPVSVTSFKLNATATDKYSEIGQYDFYINGMKKDTQATSATSANYNATGVNTGDTSCYVIVTDKLGNTTKYNIIGQTKLYVWEQWNKVNNPSFSVTGWIQQEDKEYIDTRFSMTTWYGIEPLPPTGRYNTGWSGDDSMKIGTGSTELIISQMKTWGTQYVYSIASSILYRYKFTNVIWYQDGKTIKSFTLQSWKKVATQIDNYSKGTTFKGKIKDKNRNKFPDNGVDGSYWYVYKGIE